MFKLNRSQFKLFGSHPWLLYHVSKASH